MGGSEISESSEAHDHQRGGALLYHEKAWGVKFDPPGNSIVAFLYRGRQCGSNTKHQSTKAARAFLLVCLNNMDEKSSVIPVVFNQIRALVLCIKPTSSPPIPQTFKLSKR